MVPIQLEFQSCLVSLSLVTLTFDTEVELVDDVAS